MPEGHTIHRLATLQKKLFAGRLVEVSSPQGRFAAEAALLDGHVFRTAESVGKHLFQHYRGAPSVHIHLGLFGKVMSGHGDPPDPVGALRMRIATDEAWMDLRGPTACEIIDPPQIAVLLSRLGPDPLRQDSDPVRAWQRLHRSAIPVGALLMDQKVVAGIGNVYRAELLYRHAVDPFLPGSRLREEVWFAMWADLVTLMRAGVRTGRIETVRPEDRPRLRGPLSRAEAGYVYRRQGLPCRVCGTEVRTQIMAGRNLFWCPYCQPPGSGGRLVRTGIAWQGAARGRDVSTGTGSGHVVFPTADAEAYSSLRRRSTPRPERYALGRALRTDVPRNLLGEWAPPTDRPDVVAQINQSHVGRLDWLIPVRVARMAASPYGFLRGTAVVMAWDLAQLPSTGITPVICGDAHMGNFGFYASPERELVIDLNDFDEAHPGGWEWDLRRLAASIWVAGRQNAASEATCQQAVLSCVATYREHVRWLAAEPLLSRAFERLDVDHLEAGASNPLLRKEIARAARRARTRVSDRALPRFTQEHEGVRRIIEEPPLLTRVSDAVAEQLAEALDEYLTTLPPQWRRVLSGYSLVDVAHKVVGVGSVGLRAYVALCEGSSPDDVIFLQLKQARRSVIAPYVHGESAWHQHQGQRVVEYQQALQTVSDPLLGWTTVGERQFYVRQFRNMKGTIAVDALDSAALVSYAGICGRLLAKGHARTSGASMIAGYVGGSDKLDVALARFARLYADQTEHDHARLVAAVADGRLPSDPV